MKKEEIEEYKKEVFKYVITYLESPTNVISNNYNREYISMLYKLLYREKKKVLRENPIVDECSLIKFFDDLDQIISLNKENEDIYFKFDRKELSQEEINKLMSATILERNAKLTEIEILNEKKEKIYSELNKVENELNKLGAINKLQQIRIELLTAAKEGKPKEVHKVHMFSKYDC